VLTAGYHGWHDWYVGTTPRSEGVPEGVRKDVRSFTYNDLDSLERLFREYPSDVACVILEPIGVEEPVPGFLDGVARLTRAKGAVLVFDECWTGFRLAKGGAQEYFGVESDLCCFGKGLGNGFAISAITGRRDIMKVFERVFFSLTFGGDLVGIRAALAVLDVLDAEPVIPHLWSVGQSLRDGTAEIIRRHGLDQHIRTSGLSPRHAYSFQNSTGSDWLELKSLVIQEAVQRGILFGGYHVLSYSHSGDVITKTLAIYEKVYSEVATAVRCGDVRDRLRGEPVQPVFRRL
jgi:glutamate-1-semialdehyde 2,1-aminomutase/spore coat polysaccharide biosynthesis protein SpsF